MRKGYSFSDCFRRGWDAFMLHPTPSTLGPLLGVTIAGAIELLIIPSSSILITFSLPLAFIINGLITLIAMTQLLGGLSILALHTVCDKKPSILDIFKGFRKFGKLFIAMLFYIFLLSFIAIPVFVGESIGWSTLLDMLSENLGIDDIKLLQGLLMFAMVALGIAYMSLLLGYLLVFLVISDDWFNDSVAAALNISARMTAGNKFKLFWTVIALSIFTLAGVLLIGLGIILTFMVSLMVMAVIYEDLKSESTCGDAKGWYEQHDAKIAVG